MQENKPTDLWPLFEIWGKVRWEATIRISLFFETPEEQKTTPPWPFLCKQVNQACHHCLHGKPHLHRIQQRDTTMAQWHRLLANNKQGHWSAWPHVTRVRCKDQLKGKSSNNKCLHCDLGVVGTYVTVRLSAVRVLKIDDSAHPLARRAARPDCDATCQCCWRRRRASRTPPLRSFAWLRRWCRDRGRSSASSSGSFLSSSSPARNLCSEMCGRCVGGIKEFRISFIVQVYACQTGEFDSGFSKVSLLKLKKN